MRYKLKEIKIEVSYKCNLSCIHCSSEASSSCNKEISSNDCLRIIDDACKIGVNKIAFSGGEPLLWPYIEEAIIRAKKYNIQVVIYSNGNADNIEALLQKMKVIEVDKLVFSLFGSSASTHEIITLTAGSFFKTISAIRASVNEGLATEVHFVPLSINYKELDEVAKLVMELGANLLSLLRFVPQGRGRAVANQVVLDKSQNFELRKSIELLRSKNFNIRTGSPYNFLLLNNQPRCTAAIDKLTIGPDLKIYPCDAFKQLSAEQVVGNSMYSDLSQHNLDECWNKSTYLNKIRETLQAPHDDICQSCSSFKFCQSGCLAQKILHYGKITKKPDPLCIDNKNI